MARPVGASPKLVTVTVLKIFTGAPPSVTVNVISYTLFAPASAGFSKSFCVTNVKTPVAGSIANNNPSPAATIPNVNASPSESVAVTVVTAVVFSEMLALATVNTGASATLVTVTVMV